MSIHEFIESRDRHHPSGTGIGGVRRARASKPAVRVRSRRTGKPRSQALPGQFDERSGEYYLRIFSRKRPDLNWENPEVRRAIYDMMNWWVDRGVDGFRMDVINLISTQLVDGVPAAGGPSVVLLLYRQWSPARRVPRRDERRVGLDARNLLTVGEMPGSTVETARRATDPANHELNMVFTFEHVSLDSLPGGSGKWDLVPLSLPALATNE